MREVFGRYIPSLVHASLSAFWDFVPECLGGGDSFYNLFGNSAGYFLADMIVDQDPAYYPHHIAPLLWGEAILRCGANIHHSVRCIRFNEAGNVIAHTAAILTGRSGKLFHVINTLSFWISRPLSMPDGFWAWYIDVPPEQQYTPFGLVLLASFFVTFYINGKWMIKMITPREKKDRKVSEEKEKTTENGKTNGNIIGQTKRDKGKKLKSTK